MKHQELCVNPQLMSFKVPIIHHLLRRKLNHALKVVATIELETDVMLSFKSMEVVNKKLISLRHLLLLEVYSHRKEDLMDLQILSWKLEQTGIRPMDLVVIHTLEKIVEVITTLIEITSQLQSSQVLWDQSTDQLMPFKNMEESQLVSIKHYRSQLSVLMDRKDSTTEI